MSTDNRQFRACLMGAPFNTNNRGVSALAYSLVRLIKEMIPDAKISFFMGSPERTNDVLHLADKDVAIDVINYRLSPRARIQEHLFFLLCMACLVRITPSDWLRRKIISSNSRLRDLHECNLIGDIHGGDSFSDIYGLRDFIMGIIPIVVIILLGKKLVLFPQTYGPYSSWLSRAIAGWIIRRASVVLSRELESISFVNTMLGRTINDSQIAFCPDVAFTLPAVPPSKIEIYPPTEIRAGEKIVGININGLMFHGGYTGKNMFGLKFEYKTFVLNLIKKMMNETTSRIFLIPHTYSKTENKYSDNEAARQVYETLKDQYVNRLYMVTADYNQFEVKGIIGLCDFFIGSRMHACIAAISQGVPTAAVAYSKKFHGVFEGVGLGKMVVDARSVNLDEAIQRIVDLYQNRETERISITQKIDAAKKKVKETFRQLLSTPGSESEAR